MHVKGTRPPGALALPENLKADVYLPPAFVETNEDTHVDIAKMVQNFLETFGVRTVQRWTQFGRQRGWPLNTPGLPRLHTPTNLPIIPTPPAGSSHYTFRGRPYSSQLSLTHNDDDSESAAELVAAQEIVDEYADREADFESQVLALREELQATITNLRRLELENVSLKKRLNRGTLRTEPLAEPSQYTPFSSAGSRRGASISATSPSRSTPSTSFVSTKDFPKPKGFNATPLLFRDPPLRQRPTNHVGMWRLS